MSIKKILAPIQAEQPGEAALEAALALAKRCKAHVAVLHIRQSPTTPASAYYPVGVVFVDEQIAELNKAMEDQSAKLKAVFDAVVARSGAPVIDARAHRDDSGATASWTDQNGILPYDVSAAARVSDLVVFGRSGEDLAVADIELLEEVIFQSGRPVLIAPPGAMAGAPKRIAVGWNGGREAARALGAATPLFEDAEDVAVISVDPLPSGVEGPEAVAELLRLHGVRAEAVRIDRAKGEDADETFLNKARDWKADLIVAGAYSHSRWRELVLGGFTRALIKQAKTPLLLAH